MARRSTAGSDRADSDGNVPAIRWPRALVRRAGMVVLCLCHTVVGHSQAMPANPTVRRVEQPDKTSFAVVMRGDERQGWMETLDGYTVVRNVHHCVGTRCWFEYAKLGKNGELVPSGVAVTARGNLQHFSAGQRPPKGLRPAPNPLP